MKNITSVLLNLFVVFAFVQSLLYAVLDRAPEEQQASLKRQRLSDACVLTTKDRGSHTAFFDSQYIEIN